MSVLLELVDPRLRPRLSVEYEHLRQRPHEALPRGVTVVLAGHRAAGKSTALPVVAQALNRKPIDLDTHLEQLSGRAVTEWVAHHEPDFRAAERAAFLNLPPSVVVAVGGGFLSHHPDALRRSVVVLLPLTYETYRERLLADASRPRLRPHLTLEAEIETVWAEREALHAQAPTISWVEFVVRAERGWRPRRVVTAPPQIDLKSFAMRARTAGADLLEVRTDLTSPNSNLIEARTHLPLIVSKRTSQLPQDWVACADMVDLPLEEGQLGSFISLHAEKPLSTADALRAWAHVPVGTQIKHVEPLGELETAPRLFETQLALKERFGGEAVTVLATGPWAVPFRALLATQNALDYLALDDSWAAAPGQRLVVDAVREYRNRAGPHRFAILGHHISHSRSPRIHQQPFDRLDLPAETPIDTLLRVLRPYYAGFAVTAPFKQAAARAVQATRPAVNTLVRTSTGWGWANSDVEGARAIFTALQSESVTVLGEGGVADALREAAGTAVKLTFLKHHEARLVQGAAVWTWPASVQPPAGLQFREAQVAVIAYGSPARRIAEFIRARGGIPRRLGPRWFIAQARMQRRLWGAARGECVS